MEGSAYIAYLLSEGGRSSCARSGKVLQISPDEVNRLLANSGFAGKDLFGKAKAALQLTSGMLRVDNTITDKPYSHLAAAELVAFFGSGLRHKRVRALTRLC